MYYILLLIICVTMNSLNMNAPQEQKVYHSRPLFPIPTPLPAPKRVLVFDVETTGLLPKKDPTSNANPKNEDYPYILQLSYVIYSVEKGKIVHKTNTYVNIPSDIKITDEITKITGITREMCNRGEPIVSVLIDFYRACLTCDYVVAHNIEFDSKVVQQEMYRNRNRLGQLKPILPESVSTMCGILGRKFTAEKGITMYCTMKHGMDHTDIWIEREKRTYNPDKTWNVCVDGSGNPVTMRMKKTPKLSELFVSLLPGWELPQNLHNSMVDVAVCLQCYLKMVQIEILPKEEFERIVAV